jgi:ankyrin repeat protein
MKMHANARLSLKGRELLIDRVGGGPPGTLLHHACWVGNPEIVRRLLELGADPTASGEDYGLPAYWAALASRDHALPGRDYVKVVEHLAAAGADLGEDLIEVAEGPLADWLEDHLIGTP